MDRVAYGLLLACLTTSTTIADRSSKWYEIECQWKHVESSGTLECESSSNLWPRAHDLI